MENDMKNNTQTPRPNPPKDFIGNEYVIYNPPVLARFKANLVKIRIEQYWSGIDTFRASVVYPRQHDGEFLMFPASAVYAYEKGE